MQDSRIFSAECVGIASCEKGTPIQLRSTRVRASAPQPSAANHSKTLAIWQHFPNGGGDCLENAAPASSQKWWFSMHFGAPRDHPQFTSGAPGGEPQQLSLEQQSIAGQCQFDSVLRVVRATGAPLPRGRRPRQQRKRPTFGPPCRKWFFHTLALGKKQPKKEKNPFYGVFEFFFGGPWGP